MSASWEYESTHLALRLGGGVGGTKGIEFFYHRHTTSILKKAAVVIKLGLYLLIDWDCSLAEDKGKE